MIKPVLMSKEIKFFTRDVYGNRFYYLVDSIDKWILKLTGTKTLLLRDKQTLQDVGFKFVQVFED